MQRMDAAKRARRVWTWVPVGLALGGAILGALLLLVMSDTWERPGDFLDTFGFLLVLYAPAVLFGMLCGNVGSRLGARRWQRPHLGGALGMAVWTVVGGGIYSVVVWWLLLKMFVG